jgi:hypothetical protein
LTTSKHLSKPALLQPPCSHNHGLQLHLPTRTIQAFKLARLPHPSVSPNSHDYGLEMHLQTHMITISQCISPNFLNDALQVYLQAGSIMASECIYKLAPSRSQSASESSLQPGLQVYLQRYLIIASKCISKLAQSRPGSVSLSLADRHFQANFELLASTISSWSRYAVCRLVAI